MAQADQIESSARDLRESPVLFCVKRVAQALHDDYWEEAVRQMDRLLTVNPGNRTLTVFESNGLQTAYAMVERGTSALAGRYGSASAELDGLKVAVLCLDSGEWLRAKAAIDGILEASQGGTA
jgi:hypothetical protein